MSSENGSRRSLVIGTRGSQLAMWQAEWVLARLQEVAPHLSIRLERIQTSGDKIQDVPLAKIGGKALFVKEIEEALLRKDIDLAVHSMKDVPSVLPEGLTLHCVPRREDPRDALLSRGGWSFRDLPSSAKVGTSSLRRQSQLLAQRPDLSIHMLRGNLDTRMRKLQEGQFDAIILAAAGLKRLGWAKQITECLSPDICLPAVGQGALGIEGRMDDLFVANLLDSLNDPPSRIAVTTERAFLARLEGGCQVPIAGHAALDGQRLTFHGLVASVDGRKIIHEKISGPVEEVESLGVTVAERILAAGGDKILHEIYDQA
ncbi:hydroxymethylbilane synthase [Candidatus Nitronereus thalassa]|uniref:Porphobilinogen deaminase n=1 Tax=Candidatus Nitronereus thalassa TaxID=3020898 RepID=A0ABU3KCL1_9BACT|nr:hydroxymethylbilane synthase [Candidatus Nitronereus thalassa]MDT7044255.1 hydroxymethylbilane synthase [Candidatus Nitronereus thalassa]